MRAKCVIISSVILFILACSFVNAAIIWSEDADARFEVTVYGIECEKKNGASFWKRWNGTDIIREEVTTNCFLSNAYPQTCCPSARECVFETGKCEGEPSPFTCSDYNPERYGGDEEKAKKH